MIEILTFVCGPLENNNYLLVEPESKACVVVDPSLECHPVSDAIHRLGLDLQAIWITHAHFDHFAGIEIIQSGNYRHVPVGLNPLDERAWRFPTWAAQFAGLLELPPPPDMTLHDGQRLMIGSEPVEVRFAPGHSAGHVMFYVPSAGALLCGDVIFQSSIGRTDLQKRLARCLLRCHSAVRAQEGDRGRRPAGLETASPRRVPSLRCA